MTLQQQQASFARHVAKLIGHINDAGFTCTLGAALRNRGLGTNTIGCYSPAPPDSLHYKGLAIDINIFDPDGSRLSDPSSYEEFGLYWESLNANNKWGGRFSRPEPTHFERKEV